MFILGETGHKKITDQNKFSIQCSSYCWQTWTETKYPFILPVLIMKSPPNCAMVATNLAKHSDTFLRDCSPSSMASAGRSCRAAAKLQGWEDEQFPPANLQYHIVSISPWTYSHSHCSLLAGWHFITFHLLFISWLSLSFALDYQHGFSQPKWLANALSASLTIWSQCAVSWSSYLEECNNEPYDLSQNSGNIQHYKAIY